MINFKRKRRAYIMPILKFIRKALNTFKKYAFPTYKQNLTVYDFYKEEQIKKCYEHFKEHLKTAVLLNSENIRDHAITQANENDKDPDNYFLEFGVFSGSSINFFSNKINKKIYGFDSFEGLKEDWLGTTVIKGTFDLKKKFQSLILMLSLYLDGYKIHFLFLLKKKNPKLTLYTWMLILTKHQNLY